MLTCMKCHALGSILLTLFLPVLPTQAAEGRKPFTGTIVYEQSATGKDAKAFNGMAARKITVHIGEKAYRQDEDGGINEGSVIIRDGAKAALRLDHKKKTSGLGTGTRLDDMDEKVKQLMQAHFNTPLEDTGETEKIAGHNTRKFKVGKSPFVRPGATAHIWVAQDLDIGRHRYDFNFEWHRVTAPLPQSIPVQKGTVLKAVVLENGTTVTMAVTSLAEKQLPDSLFSKPDGYKGPDFPAPAKPVPAPSGPVPDVSKLAPQMENSLGMKLALIKPGTFTMGSPQGVKERRDHEKQHQVTMTRPYYIATTEVTQAQWKAVTGEDAPAAFKGGNLPVEKITWLQAAAFCSKLSEKEGMTYRLPTEAEWEYAARAGAKSQAMSLSARRAWLKGREWTYSTAKYKTHPVGGLKPNAWGLHDMLGNVSEFTSSGMGNYPDGKATDPQGTDSDTKVVRGGDWVSVEHTARYAARSPWPKDKSKSTIGFRVVCEPK